MNQPAMNQPAVNQPAVNQPAVNQLCVIGLGLIGGSVLRSAGRAGWTVWGATESETDAAAATADGFCVSTVDDALRRTAAEDALVVIAVPLPAVPEVLAAVHRHAPRCRLTDVVSVKARMADAVRSAAPAARYVGGHPMAGSTTSGWAAATDDLFERASWVVMSEDGAEREVWAQVARLAIDCGARVVPATADDHDVAVARMSHLPHVLAAVLASVGADGGELALSLGGGSFGDGTRVAGTRPELTLAMCEGNAQALLPVLDEALGRLGAARGAFASTGSLAATVRAGYQARQEFDRVETQRGAERGHIDLADPAALTMLRDLGRNGGRIVALDGTVCGWAR